MDNLDKDIAMAMKLGYGCHYGAYKADHPHTRDITDSAQNQTVKMMVCERCGQRYFKRKHNQKYCSTRCQQLAGMQRYSMRKNGLTEDVNGNDQN